MKAFHNPFWKSVDAPSLIIWGIGFPAMVVSILIFIETWNDALTVVLFVVSFAYVGLLLLQLRKFNYMLMDTDTCCFRNALFEGRKSFHGTFVAAVGRKRRECETFR